jgi:peptidoglycan/xylan/chitin deacetylase (PgdA/CDA1 family)
MGGGVAITFDDGTCFDYYDLEHPYCGVQRSMFNILRDFNLRNDRIHKSHATSFVISSPHARSSLDKSCMIGMDWWGDNWWMDASSSGIMDIQCHSWDHVHPELNHVAQRDQIKGDFSQVNSFIDADFQFTKAGEYIASVLGYRPTLYAYPYGQVSDYVAKEYLPKYQARHQFRAAFTTKSRAVSREDDVWQLPRYVCGYDWRSPEELADILTRN